MAVPGSSGGLFREVPVPAGSEARWKHINVCTGAFAATTTYQDIKVPEHCGGYSYRDSGTAGSIVRNRFIYWRTYQNVLELVEQSLDLTLSGNLVRYSFKDAPILPKVTIHEWQGQVVILVATVASVHRLVFPHPTQFSRPAFLLSDQIVTSIFYEAPQQQDPNNQTLLSTTGSINNHLLEGSSCILSDGHALFVLATNNGGMLTVKMPPLGVSGTVIHQEMSCSSVMKKLLIGMIPGALRGSQPPAETSACVELVYIDGECYIFSVCRDLRLRVWSLRNKDCILTESLLEYTSDELEDATHPILANASGHMMKVVLGGDVSNICVYLSLQNRAKFVFLTPVLENSRLRLDHVTTLDREDPDDLVDFVVTLGHMMSLWTTQTGETKLLSTPLTQPEDVVCSCWEQVDLASTLDYVVVPLHRDPRDVYLEKIFTPGLFAPQDIIKTLNVLRHRPTQSVETDSLLSLATLKEEVSAAVDKQIRSIAMDSEGLEMAEENFIPLQQEEWDKFYSGCCQYKQVGEKAKGLMADPVTGLFCVIKKATFSVLRPCDRTEELYLSPTIKFSDAGIQKSGLTDSDHTPAKLASDLRLVCDAVQLINSRISEEMACQFFCSLHNLESPEFLVERLGETISLDEGTKEILNKSVQMSDFVTTFEFIFGMLEFCDINGDQGDQQGQQHYRHLFSGSLGMYILTESFHQLVTLRFEFVRDLTIFLFLASSNDRVGLTQTVRDSINTNLLHKGFALLRCFKVLVWASEAFTVLCPNNVFDLNIRQLSTLEMEEATSRSSSRPNYQMSYLVQMFIEGIGGEQIRRTLASLSTGGPAVWTNDFLGYMLALGYLICPTTDETVFQEFLVRTCQYLRLQEYVQLVTPWCNWNEGSRAFFLGLAYLHFNEVHKAVKLFGEASEGVAAENFFKQKLLQTEETDHYRLQTLFFLKVIRQLEEYGFPDLVISTATEAIHKADRDDPNLPTLLSKLFKHHLDLGHNQQAFHAMMNNPDLERKKDCLRQFLVILSERGHLADLVSFDYQDLEEEVVYILEHRARSVDLLSYDYYKLLFSFFINREDYRKAARVMFEKAFRLCQEVPGLRSLQQQAQCYLAAMNTLRLVRPENAWIIQPKMELDHDKAADSHSKPRNEELKQGPVKELQILELSHLEKQYSLLDARLRLIKSQSDSSLITGPTPQPKQMVSLLCTAGLYDVAVSVTKTFRLSPEPVLSSLAQRCVSLAVASSTSSFVKSSASSDPNAAAWLWLKENSLPPCGAKETSVADKAWSLLQSYISQLEDRTAVCHKCVAHTLLTQSFPLPTWLVHSYKALDVANLLRAYLTFDLLPMAAALVTEYLQALIHVLAGSDAPAFSLKGLVKPESLKIWSPMTCVDQLLAALDQQTCPWHIQLSDQVRQTLNNYLDKLYEYSSNMNIS